MNAKESNAIIITGASRGIGAATAQLAAAQGFSAAVNYKSGRSEALEVVRSIRERGGKAVAIQADVAKEQDILRLFAEAERELGAIRGLVNNAAVTGGFARVEAVSSPALEHLFAVNVTGAILCAREAVKRMSTRHGGQGGAIVNISSLAARTGSPGEWVHYAASKGAIDTFTLGLAREVANQGIRVNAVAPGLVETGVSCCQRRARQAGETEVDNSDGTPRKTRGSRRGRGVAAVTGNFVCDGVNPGSGGRKMNSLE